MEQIINKVAASGIITLDPATFLPAPESIAVFDLQPFLFRGMILREKDYRAALPEVDWQAYAGRHVTLFCSADAIIPVWAYMLAATQLEGIAASVSFGSEAELRNELLRKAIADLDISEFGDKRVVIKGCGDVHVPELAYVLLTARLKNAALSIMYGEPCSTVPVYKKPKATAV